MKQVLKANPITVDVQEYFDAEKKLYMPYPYFPFLTETEIRTAISELIDEEKLNEEIKTLENLSKTQKNTIEQTNFIICLVGWAEYPELVKLLTITREWAFRNDGGGVGCNDYDDFDLHPAMQQLIIIDPTYKDILGCMIGGYRFIVHDETTYEIGPMGAHFQYSAAWKQQQWIELGRSFVNPYFQNQEKRYSIDYVLHGLGYIYAQYPQSEGYFGKVTLYNIYEKTGADAFFLGVMEQYLTKTEDIWVNPNEKVNAGTLTDEQKTVLNRGIFKGLFYLLRTDYYLNIPKIMAVYNRMTSMPQILYFGGFRHASFGNTTEVGIAIRATDLYDVIKEKFVTPYRKRK
jgi:hypothetical protein